MYVGRSPSFVVGSIFMGFVFFIYMINRFSDLQEDFTNDIHKAVFFFERKSLLKFSIALMAAILITMLALGKLNSFHVFLLACGAAYSYKVIPWYTFQKGFSLTRIKDIPILKNITVASLWGISIFAIPLYFTGGPLENIQQISILVIALTISSFSNTLFDDVMDITGDLVARTKTIPTLYGKKRSYQIIFAANLLWGATCTLLYFIGKLDLAHLTFVLLVSLFPILYVTLYEKKWLSQPIIDFIMEMDLLLFAGGLFLLSYLV
jgi:4-hydroxybenzoate polyprenyltransferase